MSVARLFGLIGYPLSHSFSQGYFTEKFKEEEILHSTYQNFPIASVQEFPTLIESQPDLVGLNVTLPYKKEVIPYLDEIEEQAAQIGAVNTIKLMNGKLKGYNTDAIGFERSLIDLLGGVDYKKLNALVFGTGGAAQAVFFVLRKLGITFKTVSRTKGKGDLTYAEIGATEIEKFRILINTTPLGMYPKTDACPQLPYPYLSEQHYLYDLVYNPLETLFLKKGLERGAKAMNGLPMLHLQAEAAWAIWNDLNSDEIGTMN